MQSPDKGHYQGHNQPKSVNYMSKKFYRFEGDQLPHTQFQSTFSQKEIYVEIFCPFVHVAQAGHN
jgi:hypothetical protein